MGAQHCMYIVEVYSVSFSNYSYITMQKYYISLSLLLLLSSSTPYAEELEYNIDFLIEHQDIRQCHFPGDQNRAEDRYEEEAYNPNQEGQHVFQSLSPD